MKILFLCTFLLAASVLTAKAAPFLVCDEYPFNKETGLNVASFTIGGLPGGSITVPATVDATSEGQYLHYDLGNLTFVTGTSYTVTAYATNVYGLAGPPASLVFTRGVPAAPGNLRIAPN